MRRLVKHFILVVLLTSGSAQARSPSIQIAAWPEIAPCFPTGGFFDAGNSDIGTIQGYGGEIILWDILAIGVESRECRFFQDRMNAGIFPWPESIKDVSWHTEQTGFFGRIYFGPFKTVKQYIKFGALTGKIHFSGKFFHNPEVWDNPPENFERLESYANQHWGTSFAFGCRTRIQKYLSFHCEVGWSEYFLSNESMYSTIRGDHILIETNTGFHYADYVILRPKSYAINLRWMEIRFGLRLSVGT